MNSETILSTSMQIAAYCPPVKSGMPGVPERAYQPPSPTNAFKRSLRRRTGEWLIHIGQRLANVEHSKAQWVKELT